MAGQVVGTLRQPTASTGFDCFDAVPDARVVVQEPPGVIAYSARSNLGKTWSGTVNAPYGDGTCYGIELTCANGVCGGPDSFSMPRIQPRPSR
jgi:hypothetical protein